MDQIVLLARAKINWTLDVIGKRADGYHRVDMLMQSINLYDRITIQKAVQATTLTSDSQVIPMDQGNLAWKAVDVIKKHFKRKGHVAIFLEKRIPVAAGLAGGSTDAAAVLVGLNHIWELGANLETLMQVGVKLGADVPFCLLGGTARAEGIGECLTPFTVPSVFHLVLIKPYGGVSTQEVYQSLCLDTISHHPRQEKALEGLLHGNPTCLAEGLGNVLEQVTLGIKPEIGRIKAFLMETGALCSMMSGSGPTVYGLFLTRERARKSYLVMKRRYRECFLVTTSREGISVVE